MRTFAALWILLLASPALGETWYAQRLSQTGGAVGVEHLWSSGDSLRSEVVVGARPIVTGVHGDRYWIQDRMTGKGISVRRHPNAVKADASRARPFGDEAERLLRRGGEYVRDESLGGEASCKLYKLTDDAGRQEVCVGADENELPVYIVSWDRKSKREGRTSYMNWIRSLEIDPQFFEAPSGPGIQVYTYEAFVKASAEGSIGPAPVIYPHLLHGDREQ